MLETLGGAGDLIGLRYLYELRDHDHPQATRDNRGYAFTLVRNIFPDWAEADVWLRAAIERSESEANRLPEPTVIDRGAIRLQARYFVGTTASVEIKIFPRSTQI